MLRALYSSATGMKAQEFVIDVTANNLANVNTIAFKKSRVNFEDLLYQQIEMAGGRNAQGVTRPAGTEVGLGTRVSNTQILFSQGPLVNSERNLDTAIDGDGFFKVRIFDEINGGIGYTRAGNFFKNRDGELVIGSSNGFRLDPPITVPTNVDPNNITILSDGRVLVQGPEDTEPQEVGQIQLSRFVNPEGLEQIGGNVYIETDASGEAIESNPGTQGLGVLISGFLEQSNVDAVKELVGLIKTQRAFELNSKVITTSNEMLQVVTSLKQ
jgi:flagellar basal-body rod protein FlgG